MAGVQIGVKMRACSGSATMLACALLLAGCGSTNMFNTSALDLFSTSSKATTGNAAAGEEAATDVECPSVDVRTGAATLMIGSKPGEGEPSALDLRYQGTIVRTARECRVSAGIMTMKVGIEGRVITGPAGGPGTVDIPLRIAVVQEGINPKAITSRFVRIQVGIASGSDRAPFTHVDPDVIISDAGARCRHRLLCGLCRVRSCWRAGKEKARAQIQTKAETGREATSELIEGYQPRRSKIALLSARRSEITERAPAERKRVSS